MVFGFEKKFDINKTEENINEICNLYERFSYGEIDEKQLKNLLKRPIKELNKVL